MKSPSRQIFWRRHGAVLKASSAAFALLALAACTPTRTIQPETQAALPAAWADQQAQLMEITAFDMDGRIATGAVLGASGTLSWQQSADTFVAVFSGALGIGGVRVEGTGESLTVTTREGHFDRADADALLKDRLGWTPPWQSLRRWIVGLPDPSSVASLHLDGQGQLASLSQAGWQIDYLEFRATPVFSRPLPRKLTLSHVTDQGTEGKIIRVVVDQWNRIETNTDKDNPSNSMTQAQGSDQKN